MGHKEQIYDRERLSLDIVRLKKGGKNFEVILSDPNRALELRRGNSKIDVKDVLRAKKVFSNARQAKAASENDMKKIFETDSQLEAARQVIITGDFHLTAEQKRAILDSKRNKIINYIHMNALNPKTGSPHPKKRIELAMEEANVHVNMFEGVASQTEQVVKKLRPIIPMSFEKLRLRISIPARYASKTYSILKSNFKVKNEAWQNDGSVMVELELQAGKKDNVFNSVNKLTKGEAHITEVKTD